MDESWLFKYCSKCSSDMRLSFLVFLSSDLAAGELGTETMGLLSTSIVTLSDKGVLKINTDRITQ